MRRSAAELLEASPGSKLGQWPQKILKACGQMPQPKAGAAALRLTAGDGLCHTSYWSPRLRIKAGTSSTSCGQLLVTLLFTWCSDGLSRAGADGARCRAGASVFCAGSVAGLEG